jgi:hypothetical protein
MHLCEPYKGRWYTSILLVIWELGLQGFRTLATLLTKIIIEVVIFTSIDTLQVSRTVKYLVFICKNTNNK